MFSMLTSHANDRLRRVILLANEEAQRLNHEYIGTEHLLLGIINQGEPRNGDSGGIAAKILRSREEVGLEKIRIEIGKQVKSGPEMITMGKLPMTPRAKNVMEYAFEERKSMNHQYLSTGHLLIGLLREHGGVAELVLRSFGFNIKDVREAVLSVTEEEGDLAKPEAQRREWSKDAAPSGSLGPPPPKLPGLDTCCPPEGHPTPQGSISAFKVLVEYPPEFKLALDSALDCMKRAKEIPDKAERAALVAEAHVWATLLDAMSRMPAGYQQGTSSPK